MAEQFNQSPAPTKTEFDALNDSKQDKTDSTLDTTAKTVSGAINELNGNITTLGNKITKIHGYTYLPNSTSNSWEHMWDITLPDGKFYLLMLYQSWSYSKPIGFKLETTSGMVIASKELEGSMSSIQNLSCGFLPPGTYSVYTKRYGTTASDKGNQYQYDAICFDL